MIARPRLALLVLLPLAAAGCVAPASDAPPGDGDAPPLLPTLDVPLEPGDCRMGLLIFLTTMEQAQQHLPPGFAARDAQMVLGTPAPTGKGAVMVSNLFCESSALGPAGYEQGEILVAVHAPDVDADLAPSTSDFYAPAFHVPVGPLRDLLASAGWNLLDGAMTLETDAQPAGATAAGAFEDADGVAWRFDVAAGAPITATAFERIWHATPGGLSFIENDYSNSAYLGDASCELRAGSAASEVAGATACEAGSVVGAVVPAQSWTARFVTLPGVLAE